MHSRISQLLFNSGGNTVNLTNVKAPKNGYAYVFISNRSNQDVYFDNFKVQITAGNLIEENHYYAYGLKIASISSVKLGDAGEGGLTNNYKYQGSYSELDADIGWNDFELRNYDAQIGRWVQQDPYQEYASPYLGMGNDPINTVDPNGGDVLGLTAGLFRTMTTLGGAIIGGDVSAATGGSFWKGAAIGAAVGFAAGYVPTLIGGGVGSSVSHAVSLLNVSVHAVGAAKDIMQAGNRSKDISRWSSGYMNRSSKVHGPMVDVDNPDDGSNSNNNNNPETKRWDLDGDGKLSLHEANNWRRNGFKQDIEVDASKIDIGYIDTRGLKDQQQLQINFLAKPSTALTTGLVYGTLDLIYDKAADGFRILPNKYDFDIGGDAHPWSGEPIRNALTYAGKLWSGWNRNDYMINFSGIAKSGPFNQFNLIENGNGMRLPSQ